jgi:hypothetical protein
VVIYSDLLNSKVPSLDLLGIMVSVRGTVVVRMLIAILLEEASYSGATRVLSILITIGYLYLL